MRKSEPTLPVLLAAALALAAPAAAEPVGFVAGLEGVVEVERGGQSSWTAAQLDQDIQIGDTVRTGPDSAVKIVLVDDTTLSLGEETELAIDRFVVGDAATREPSVLRQLRGQIRTRVGEAFGGTTRLEMHTPTAVMGVKGTVFTSQIARLGSELSTLGCNFEGSVFIRFLNDLTVWDVPLDKCRRAFADRIEEPIEPPPDFVDVSAPSAGAGPEQTQALLFEAGAGGGPEQGLDEWVASAGLPEVAAGPGEGLEADQAAGIASEPVFEGREDVAAARAGENSIVPSDFPIGGGETPPQE